MNRIAPLLPVVLIGAVIFASCGTKVAAAAGDGPKLRSEMEEKLIGNWVGGPCMGSLTFAADGTFQRRHYSPGDNQMSGTWTLDAAAPTPTLVLMVKGSDDPESFPVGKIWELKVARLDAEVLNYEYASGGGSTYRRQALVDEAAKILGGRIVHATVKHTLGASSAFDDPQVGDHLTLDLSPSQRDNLQVVRESTKTKAVALPISAPARVVAIRQGDRSQRPRRTIIDLSASADGKLRLQIIVGGGEAENKVRVVIFRDRNFIGTMAEAEGTLR